MKKIKNSQPQTKFTGSYKKKSVNGGDSLTLPHYHPNQII